MLQTWVCYGKQTLEKLLYFSKGNTVARVAREPLGYRMQSVQTDKPAHSSPLLLLHRLAEQGIRRQSSAHSIVDSN